MNQPRIISFQNLTPNNISLFIDGREHKLKSTDTDTNCISIASFMRLWKLVDSLPKAAKKNWPYDSAYWYGNSDIIWRPKYRGNRGGYWNAFYDISRVFRIEMTKRNQQRAFRYALKHYGWNEKQYNGAHDTYDECVYGYGEYPRD